MSETTIEVRTPHFEGSHTSHDWQPYRVAVISHTAKTVTVRSPRLIEGHRRVNGTSETPEYRLRLDWVRGL